jgi:hypothetical protein
MSNWGGAGAVASGVGSLVGGMGSLFGGGGSGGSEDIANAMWGYTGAIRDAAENAMRVYRETKERLTPGANLYAPTTERMGSWLGLSGYPAIDANALLLNMPGYSASFDAGVRARNALAAAKGLGGSGAAQRGLTKWGQDITSQYGQQYLNNLARMADMAQNAITMTGQQGTQAASTAGQLQTQAGQLGMQGTYDVANLRQSAYNNNLNNLMKSIGLGTYALGQVPWGKAANWLGNLFTNTSANLGPYGEAAASAGPYGEAAETFYDWPISQKI